jgi:hypothetical protein
MSLSRTETNELSTDAHDDIIYNPDASVALSCIQSKEPRSSWANNPNDPYIYVSFSLEQYVSTYGGDCIYSDAIHRTIIDYHAINMKKNREEEYKKVITDEWIKRSGLPIKFLPNDETPNNIEDKNVCFILGALNKDISKFGTTITYTLNAPRFKTILMTSNQNEKLSNGDIYAFLHETGHAFLGMKHFKPQGPHDVAPYCALDCKDSVMAYFGDCKAVLNSYVNLLNENIHLELTDTSRSLLEISNSINDKISGKVIDTALLHKAIHSHSPNQLGRYDLLLVESFKQDWVKTNKELAEVERRKQERYQLQYFYEQAKMASQAVIDTITNIILRPYYWLDSQFDSVLNYVLYSTSAMVEECPKYFPPNDVTSVRNRDKFDVKANQCVSNHYASLFSQPKSDPRPLQFLSPTPMRPTLGK